MLGDRVHPAFPEGLTGVPASGALEVVRSQMDV